MTKSLRVLIVEDSEKDAALLVRELRRAAYDLTHQRVETREAMFKALDDERWDIVISDFSMPQFSALGALSCVQNKGLDIPVIIVSGTIGEEAAVAALRAGARDFIVKGAHARLIPAIDRELREAVLRSERRQVSRELEISNEMFLRAIESMSEGFAIYDPDDRLVRMNSHFKALYDATLQERNPIGLTFEELVRLEARRGCYLPGAESEEDFVQKRLMAHRQPKKSFIYRNLDGRWLRARDYPMPDGSIIAVRTDVSELVESEERFRTLADNLPGVVFRQTLAVTGDLRDDYVSPSIHAAVGVDAKEFISGRDRLLDYLHTEDRDRMLEALRISAANLEPLVMEVRRIAKPSGEVGWWQINATPRRLNDGMVQFDGIALDVTDRRAAEEQLRQALKMEAIGQLTGGIAHDFNNLLSVIMGNADLLEENLGTVTEGAQRLIHNIIEASDRAADLTQRLLAFARKQPLLPRVVSINESIIGMKALLQRALGEDIDIEMKLSTDLWEVLIDEHQMEAAVLNLAINARDAMAEGGHLMIETANTIVDEETAQSYGEVAPGEFVTLNVTDDGSGIAPEILTQIVEPFFTTKPSGKGTGLGLSMVYGFAKQSGGHLTIYSEVGHGSTFRLYFPRTRQPAMAKKIIPLLSGEPVGGHETILVVEDESAVRQSAIALLRTLGYSILEASGGEEALAIAERGDHIDLLFTDIIMPGGMTGRTLAQEMQKRRRGLRVLYCSGYTANAISHQGRSDENTLLLQKPYKRRDLARMVREVLDAH
jgi:PAS domain S-box-containing protein